MARGSRYYTVVFIPDDQRRTFTLKLPAAVMKTVLVMVLLFGTGAMVLMLRAGSIALQLQLLQYLKQENKRLREETQRIADIRRRLEALERMNAYLERLFAGRTGLLATSSSPVPSRGAADRESPERTDDSMAALPAAGVPTGTLSSQEKARQSYAERFLQSVPYIRPVQGWITRGFSDGGAGRESHPAVDFAAIEGTPIRATAPGLVEEVTYDEYLGKLVTVKHLSGFTTRYGHCGQVLVSKGDHVERGQTIATVGSTGRSSGPHLHYEILRNGKHVNPILYLADQ